MLLTVEFSVRLGRAAKALLMVQVSEREPCRGQTQPSPPNINLSAEGFRQSGVGGVDFTVKLVSEAGFSHSMTLT